ncbi:MAG: hypothetical protein LIO81_02095 [Clostridiales bacterium]|nr:hypothetical protein [Clostridiales bacterium]
MKKQISFQEYRRIDLLLWAVMLMLFETIIIKASNSWFADQPFTVSLAGAMTAIVYMRWGAWGGIHAALSGFVFCLFSGGTVNQYIIYTAGNLFSLASVPLLKRIGCERVREGQYLCLLFPALVLFLMQTGRAAVAVVLGAEPAAALGFYTTDALSMLFTLVIIWIVHRLDGVYEEQRHYLLRIQEEEKNA